MLEERKKRKASLASHHEAILRPQLVVGDLGLGGEVRRCVIVGRDELGVLVFMQLIWPGLQHSLLKVDAPLELDVAKRTKRHEEAEKPVLRSAERGGGGVWRVYLGPF